jgi:hypothetical protein
MRKQMDWMAVALVSVVIMVLGSALFGYGYAGLRAGAPTPQAQASIQWTDEPGTYWINVPDGQGWVAVAMVDGMQRCVAGEGPATMHTEGANMVKLYLLADRTTYRMED